MTARELWVKLPPPLACLLSKLQLERAFYGGAMESQARVPPVPALFIVNSTAKDIKAVSNRVTENYYPKVYNLDKFLTWSKGLYGQNSMSYQLVVVLIIHSYPYHSQVR